MKLYQRFFEYIDCNLKYINDFFNISTFRHWISTYRQKLKKIIPILLRACKCEIAQDFILYVAKVV
ncbi:hypothetical protein CU648_10670 [Bacillus sp. HBCD-sjtu]|nr:hypothetical protein CU648_10670 [Bacillus sp. HBCD-sjtu]